ncbi:MAG: 5'/3'-nucleotidase SurE [Bacteroidales bacterium]|nr:5'/3'-nucleotidase SurE [Bacteroidales bacterium]
MMNDMDRPLILISNDDGIEAPGIRELALIAQDMGDVYVVAPMTPQSGQSSAMTVNAPLRVKQHVAAGFGGNVKVYSVSGTPVDCVKLALNRILPRRPDIMLCGINHGSNAGNNLIYSGTMGAVMEACMAGIASVGYSLTDHAMDANFSVTVPFIKEITRRVIAKGLPSALCLNVNFPVGKVIKGMKVVRSAASHWSEEYREYIDPHGIPFYWLTGSQINEEPGATDTDLYWLDRQYATIVPATPDQTNVAAIEAIADVFE